jgi:hypothetical protein
MTADELATRRAAMDGLGDLMAAAMDPPVLPELPGRLDTFPDLIQGTDEWLDQRRGMITASVVGQLLTTKNLAVADNDTSRGLTALLAAERITGYTDPNYVNDDMLRGTEDEPRAVEAYSQHFAPAITDGFMVRSWGRCRLGYSPDGLVGTDGLLEVKSRRQKGQLMTVVAGEVPAPNMAQCQAGLFVTGRQWLDYISYSGGMHLFPIRVLPDPKWFAAIVAAVDAFEQTAADMVAAYMTAVEGLPLTERPATEMII